MLGYGWTAAQRQGLLRRHLLYRDRELRPAMQRVADAVRDVADLCEEFGHPITVADILAELPAWVARTPSPLALFRHAFGADTSGD
jgi:hypothetical protein